MNDEPPAGDAAAQDAAVPPFDPVPLRPRHDGWTPERQVDFIEALGESACVEDACRAVGMSVASAYALRRRAEALSFREAWDAALDYRIRRLSDAVISRAIKGVARPVFYQGEQVGERRFFNDRLAMFLLRYRDPLRYGAWLDKMDARQHPDGAALLLALAANRAGWDAARAEMGLPPAPRLRRNEGDDDGETPDWGGAGEG